MSNGNLSTMSLRYTPFIVMSPGITGPNWMALLTISKESALTEAGNLAFTSSVFHL